MPLMVIVHLGICFNPRICKRCDILATREIAQRMCFNPRICKRCDYDSILPKWLTYVSIHASVKDATNYHSYHY